MTRFWPLAMFGVPALMFVSGRPLWIVAGVGWLAVWTLGYFVSLGIKREVVCRMCHGEGYRRGLIFRHAMGDCFCCHGYKTHVRWGTRVFRASRSAGMLAERGSRR